MLSLIKRSDGPKTISIGYYDCVGLLYGVEILYLVPERRHLELRGGSLALG